MCYVQYKDKVWEILTQKNIRSLRAKSTTQIIIKTARVMIHDLAVVLFSTLRVFSKCTFAFCVEVYADSILKSILSRMVPYSTTNSLRSLKSAAKSWIDFDKDWISCLLATPLIFAVSLSKICSSSLFSCVSNYCPSSPWISFTFSKWMFSIRFSSQVCCLSFCARIVSIFFLICSSDLTEVSTLDNSLSFRSLYFINEVTYCVV